jgi:hypothetical protein
MKYKDKNEERAWEMFRKSVGPRVWTMGDLGLWFSIGMVVGILLAAPMALADNVIEMEQTGDTLILGVDQFGYDNNINMSGGTSYITAAGLSMYLVQVNTNQTASPNEIRFDEIDGTGNQMKLGQGVDWQDLGSETNMTWNYDNIEGGGHEMDITLYGDYNKLAVQQTNQATSTDGHNFDLHLAGDYNEVKIKQQSDGAKNVDLTIYNDYNDAFIRQKGNGAYHNATVTLDGLYGTDLVLKQLSGTTQTYSLSVNCMTVGGCSTTVTQE